MLEDIKAVIFDLDGTLVDSMWMWEDIDRSFLEERGIVHPEGLSHEINGLSMTETAHYFINRFSLTESVDELKRIWNDMAYKNYETRVPLKKGALAFMTHLKAKGIPMGIATSNSPELAEVVYDKYHLERFMGCVMTSCQVGRGKPFPDVYLEVARQLQVDPKTCMVFEDGVMGIQAGKNAGMHVCAVEDEDTIMIRDQIKHMADYYIRDYFDVVDGTYEDLTRRTLEFEKYKR